jgi:hypothetical protein
MTTLNLEAVLENQIRPFLKEYVPQLELITFTKNKSEWSVIYRYHNIFNEKVNGTLRYGGNPEVLPQHFPMFLESSFFKSVSEDVKLIDDCTYLLIIILKDVYKEQTAVNQKSAIELAALFIDGIIDFNKKNIHIEYKKGIQFIS